MEIIGSVISTGQDRNYNNFAQSVTQLPPNFYVTGIFKRQ